MKMYSEIASLLLTLYLITACTPAATPTVEPQPTPAEKYHSLETRTGIEEIDIVLAAIASGDSQSVRDLFNYSTLACMTVHALGGPPPCRAGEAEGTLVEVLPTLGPEGSYLYKDEINSWPGLDVTGLYAIYQVADNAYTDPYYPKGDYGAILIGEKDGPNIVLQIKEEGIVRMDFILDISSGDLTATVERNAAELILAPIT